MATGGWTAICATLASDGHSSGPQCPLASAFSECQGWGCSCLPCPVGLGKVPHLQTECRDTASVSPGTAVLDTKPGAGRMLSGS